MVFKPKGMNHDGGIVDTDKSLCTWGVGGRRGETPPFGRGSGNLLSPPQILLCEPRESSKTKGLLIRIDMRQAAH